MIINPGARGNLISRSLILGSRRLIEFNEPFNFNDRGFGAAFDDAVGSIFRTSAVDVGRFSGNDRLDGLATVGNFG